MNHLAHLFLAEEGVEPRVGNVLGDFARGVAVNRLPDAVQAGLENHRAVDAFTDQHPEVLAAKRVFSAQRRRFAGVALDVLFDHYLLRHWPRFTDCDREGFIQEVYRDLEAGYKLMPQRMAEVMARMIAHDWFTAYKDLDTIGYALDRIADRIRFQNQFAGIIEEIRAHDRLLEQHFLAFFPDLLAFNQARLV
ncbi:MAG: ACP phosphodiesterase [Marinobacter sp.]|nr:ACP phosphodiesterase [Marinobacter sp.]